MKTFKQFIVESSRQVTKPQKVYYYSFADTPQGRVMSKNMTTRLIEDDRAAFFVDDNDFLHNVHGPAFKNYYVSLYYIHGMEYTEEEFDRITKNVDQENREDVVDLTELF